LDRIELFLDLEYLQVDDQGFWPYLYDENRQPTPAYDIPCYAQPVFGELPCGVWYSHKVRRMLKVPPGHSEVHRDASTASEQARERASDPDADLEKLPPPMTP
jgi:hypothetical protein